VCDESVSIDTKVCPSCSTDLTLFSAEDGAPGDGMNADELKLSLMSEDNGHMTDLIKAAEDETPLQPKPQPVDLVYDDSVECPECGKPIPADAEKCPHCGVQFEVEEVFECPMCGSLLGLTVTKCPSCGAEFEEAAPETPEPSPPVIEKKPEPVPEPRLGPVSFVDRLKQVKDEPVTKDASPQIQKELTFAERMKAMKEGKAPEEQPQPAPVQVRQATPAPAPTQIPSPVPASTPAASTNISDRVKSLQQGASVAEPAPAPTHKPVPTQDIKADQYRELPRYIGEVKRLLILANELKIDVSTSKSVINRAVTAGKSRDLETAVRLVKEGKAGIEKELRTVYLSKIRTLESAIGLETKSGKDVSVMESALSEARKSLEAGDFQIASDSLKKIEDSMMISSPSKLSEAELDSVSCALDDAEYLRLNISEAKSFYDEAMIAAANSDSQRSFQLTKQATESLNRILPSYIASEMRKAKITLREIKMMNVDISSPVNMLKDVNDHVLRGNYCVALTHIRAFKEFIQKVEK